MSKKPVEIPIFRMFTAKFEYSPIFSQKNCNFQTGNTLS